MFVLLIYSLIYRNNKNDNFLHDNPGILWFKSFPRYFFPSTLLSVFVPKGARDFSLRNAKNRPRSGLIDQSEAGFLCVFIIFGYFAH